jgi:hypothetical protein
MTSRDFCYWLQGYFEVNDAAADANHNINIDKPQIECIRKHLAMVFKHEIDPSMGSKEHQAALSQLHETRINC